MRNNQFLRYSSAFLFALGSIVWSFRQHTMVENLLEYPVDQYYQRAEAYQSLLQNSFFFISIMAVFLAIFAGSFPSIRGFSKELETRLANCSDSLFLIWIPMIYFFICSWTAITVIGGVPRVFDAFNYYFQAKNLALFQFSAPEPPLPELFRFPFIIMREGKWYGSVYPGFPLLLALGVKTGFAPLINPFIGACTVSLMFSLVKDVLGPKSARFAVLLAVISPFFRLMNSIFMSHAAATFWVTLAMWMIWRWGRHPRQVSWIEPFFTGMSLGWLYITRPQAGAVTLPAFLIWLLYRVRWCGWKRLLIFLAPVMCFIIFLGIYNQSLTGDFRTNPRYFVDPGRSLGFGEDIGEPLPGGIRSGHNLIRGLRNANLLAFLLNAEISGWGSWNLLGWFSILMFFTWIFKTRQIETWLFSSCLIFNLMLYVFYFTPSPNFGPRYLAESVPACIVIMVSGFKCLHDKFLKNFSEKDQYHSFLVLLVTGMTILSAIMVLPAHTAHYGVLPDKLDQSRIPIPDGPSIILIPVELQTMNTFLWNSPDLTGNIFVPLKEEISFDMIKEAFPLKEIYILNQDKSRQDVYRLVFASNKVDSERENQ